jgi:hypothetical protein
VHGGYARVPDPELSLGLHFGGFPRQRNFYYEFDPGAQV